jgi:hypothetical protein
LPNPVPTLSATVCQDVLDAKKRANASRLQEFEQRFHYLPHRITITEACAPLANIHARPDTNFGDMVMWLGDRCEREFAISPALWTYGDDDDGDDLLQMTIRTSRIILFEDLSEATLFKLTWC